MKNALVILLTTITITGCSMTPEQKQRMAYALNGIGQQMVTMGAAPQAPQRRLVPASCHYDYQNRLVCTGARYE